MRVRLYPTAAAATRRGSECATLDRGRMRAGLLFVATLACACGGALIATEPGDGGPSTDGDRPPGPADAAAGTGSAVDGEAAADAGPVFTVVASLDAGLLLECSGSTCDTCLFQTMEGGLCEIVPAGAGGQYGGARCSPGDGGDACISYGCLDESDAAPPQLSASGPYLGYCPWDYKDGGALGPDGAALGSAASELWDDAGEDAGAYCVRYARADFACIGTSSEGFLPLGLPYAYDCPAYLFPSIPTGCSVLDGPSGGSPGGPFTVVCCSN
jgi:hypothetical protein